MKAKTFLAVCVMFLGWGIAWADMIEVNEKGVMNGKVLSQDQDQVTFKDASGTVHVFAKTDVLYLDISSGSAETGMPVAQRIRLESLKFMRWVKELPNKFKRTTDGATGKLVGKMSKPIDRSGVNAKSTALATAMDQASHAAVALSKKNLSINQELKERNADFIMDPGEKKKNKHRFASLD